MERLSLPLHLLKYAVGVADLDHFRRLRAARAAGPVVTVRTRGKPRRAAEVAAGGSLYWIVKGFIEARQRVLAIDDATDDDGQPLCLLRLNAALVPTVAWPHRPMQGWRYLAEESAPADLSTADGDDDLPPALARELRTLGLL